MLTVRIELANVFVADSKTVVERGKAHIGDIPAVFS